MDNKRKNSKLGGRYGMLIALEIIKKETSHRKNVFYKCLCDCGNYKEVHSDNLRENGGVRSCGCNRYYGNRAMDLTNQKFNRLTALEPTKKRAGKSIVWKCKCECGIEKEIAAPDLIRGKTKSCGCLFREQKPKSYNPDRFMSLTEDVYMDNIAKRSREKGWEKPEVTLEDFFHFESNELFLLWG